MLEIIAKMPKPEIKWRENRTERISAIRSYLINRIVALPDNVGNLLTLSLSTAKTIIILQLTSTFTNFSCLGINLCHFGRRVKQYLAQYPRQLIVVFFVVIVIFYCSTSLGLARFAGLTNVHSRACYIFGAFSTSWELSVLP